MGYAKSKMLEIEERGYGESDKLVCGGCVKDFAEGRAEWYKGFCW